MEIVALDLGTTKFCLSLLKRKPKQSDYSIETLSVPAAGMSKGMLADFAKAKAALGNLLDLCQTTYGYKVSRVAVGVAGSHLVGKSVSVSTKIPNKIVDLPFLRSLAEKVERENSSDLREILHTVPQSFRIDERQEVSDPIGFSGDRIKGEYFVIEADRNYLRDVVRLCNSTGLEVCRLLAEPFASASVTLTEEEKESGVVLVDIGGGTADAVMFREGKPVGLFTLDVAGKAMTRDLAMGLNIPLDDAERLKLRFGISPGSLLEPLRILNLAEHPLLCDWKDVYPILVPRIRELGQLIMLAANMTPQTSRSGIRLTGGGAQVAGLCEFLSSSLHVKVSPVIPTMDGCKQILGSEKIDITGSKKTFSSKYATVLGIINLELARYWEQSRSREIPITGRYLNRFVNWIREIS